MVIIRDLWKFSRLFVSYFKAELGGRRRVLLSAVWNETDSDRGDEYNGLNIILLLHLIRHLMDFFLTLFWEYSVIFWLFHRISMNMFWDSLSLFVNLARHSDVAHISDESEKLLSLGWNPENFNEQGKERLSYLYRMVVRVLRTPWYECGVVDLLKVIPEPQLRLTERSTLLSCL